MQAELPAPPAMVMHVLRLVRRPPHATSCLGERLRYSANLSFATCAQGLDRCGPQAAVHIEQPVHRLLIGESIVGQDDQSAAQLR